ncbi:MAG: hypothetical protein Q8K31_04380 [Burkholderiaceae bacterium]|nr:hypothetical protein [Burkholderiaceae bacterium]
MNRHPSRQLTLQQAADDSPMLARLSELAHESRARLKAVEMLIPGPLLSSVQAGPIDGSEWCLLVYRNAAAAKLRQMLPALLSHLRSRGCEVNSIRLKVQIARK